MDAKYSEFGYNGAGKAEDILRWAIERYGSRIVVACSFELPVTAHMALMINPETRIISVDTGRLPEETYECAEAFKSMFGANIEWYFPDRAMIEKLERERGMFSFKQSLEDRRECCRVRKLEPLSRALEGVDAWVTGRRKGQNITRNSLEKIEWDDAHGGLLKINPLADWTSRDVKAYMKRHNVPANKLLSRGYTSVGCSCCTRAIEPGEDPRAGRWWWEQPEHKECGLHVRNWSI